MYTWYNIKINTYLSRLKKRYKEIIIKKNTYPSVVSNIVLKKSNFKTVNYLSK